MKRLKIKDNKIGWFKLHYKELGYGRNIILQGDNEKEIYYKDIDYLSEDGAEYECSILVNYRDCKIPFEIGIYIYSEDELEDGIDTLINLEALHELYTLDLVELYEVE